MEIRIPAGAKTGTRVRMSGGGGSGTAGAATGDLYLHVTVLPDPRFERKGDDLYTTAEVDLYTALLGGQTRVPTLAGPVSLNIKAGTQNGQSIRLRGKGMPKLRGKDEYGDLYARVDVRLPTQLTPRQRELLEELRKASPQE